MLSPFATESVATKYGREEIWYIFNHFEKSNCHDINKEKTDFDCDFEPSLKVDHP